MKLKVWNLAKNVVALLALVVGVVGQATTAEAQAYRYLGLEFFAPDPENFRICRAAAYQEATLRTVADYWVAVGVSATQVFAVIDELTALQTAACDGYMTTSQHKTIMDRFEANIQTVINTFGSASGLSQTKAPKVFWRSSHAEIGRVARLCGGDAKPSGRRSFLDGLNNASIDLLGRSMPGQGEVFPITRQNSQFSIGGNVPCINAGSGGAGGGGGGVSSGGGASGGYDTWVWGQSHTGVHVPGCFDQATSGNACGPWSGAASFPNTEEGRVAKNEANRDTAILTIVLTGAAGAAGIIGCVSGGCALTALAIAAGTAGLVVKSYWDNYQEADSGTTDAIAPGSFCPIISNSTPVRLRSPSGVGPLGEHDALEMCAKRCDVNTGINCFGINSKISCNYNPIGLNSFPLDICIEHIVEDNPWLLWSKMEAEVCGRMSCPLNTLAGSAPTGQCTCTPSSGGLGGPAINWSCSRITCDPWGQSCAWGC